jgi:perosamine synthetase
MMQWQYPLFKVHMPVDAVMGRMREVLESGYLAEGAQVQQFERAFGDWIGNPHVFATNACTSALQIALRESGVGPGTKVIMSPMTCVATACPVTALGAEILWADCDPATGLIDIASVLRIEDPAVRAVVAVHWGGDLAPVAALGAYCRQRGWKLIEDAAQAFGAAHTAGMVGATGSDYVCFYFQAIKHLTTGDGGMVACGTAAQAEAGKLLTWFGIDKHQFRLASGEINWDLDIPQAGYKMHMNNIAAAIGLAQLPRMPRVLALHRDNGHLYETLLADAEGVRVAARRGRSAYWVFTLLASRRDELMAYLQGRGVQASLMHTRIDVYTGLWAAPHQGLPGADRFAAEHLCLPCGWWLTPEQIGEIAQMIKDFYHG